MKSLYITATSLLLLVGFYFIEQETKEHEAPGEPAFKFMMQRLSPDGNFDQTAFRRAMEQAASMAALRGGPKGFDAAWESEGPTNVGGRITCLVADPTDKKTMYAGTPNGGIFKTTDFGKTWTPIFDGQSSLAIGSIAIDPADRNTVWAGTGDPDLSYAYMGNGIYKSTDAGLTWKNMGLAGSGIISKIYVQPGNSQVVYAAVQGNILVRDNSRGLYKSTDGGQTWTQKLFVSNQTGICDMLLDKTDSMHIIAASWQSIRKQDEIVIGGAESGLWQSFDGGDSWQKMGSNEGVPTGSFSRIGLVQHGMYPKIVYVVMSDANGSNYNRLLRSSDAGKNFVVKTSSPTTAIANGYAWYFSRIGCDYRDTSTVYLCGIDEWRSVDAGASWARFTPKWDLNIVHADGHSIMSVGKDSILFGTDAGIYQTFNNGSTWKKMDNMPITEFYRVAVSPFVSRTYMGGTQDNGTIEGGGNSADTWAKVYGGDGFQPIYNPHFQGDGYVMTQNGKVYPIGSTFSITNWGSQRVNWDMPLIMSRANPDVLYAGSASVYRNTNGSSGPFSKVSPDLTGGSDYWRNISALCEGNPTTYIYAGTTDGRLWRSSDNTKTWKRLDTSLPKRQITSIKAAPDFAGNNKAIVYMTENGYRMNDTQPYLYRSMDTGNTWTGIGNGLPHIGINDICAFPGNDSVLFVATDAGVYATVDAAQSWHRLGKGMPICPVFDLELDTNRFTLIAGTYARSMLSFPLDSIMSRPQQFWQVGISASQNSIASVRVYPNPASDFLFVDAPIGSSIELISVDGKRIQTFISKQANSKLSLNGLPAGIYLLRVSGKGWERVEKIVH